MHDDTLDALLQMAAGDDRDALRAAFAAVPAATAERLVASLAARADGAALAALDHDSAPKPLRKQVRRAVHGLRSRGVAVPEPERAASKPLAPLAEPVEAAGYIAVIGIGVRLVVTMRGGRRPIGCDVLLDRRERIITGGWFEASRRAVRELLESPMPEDCRLVEAPAGHIAARLRASTSLPASTDLDFEADHDEPPRGLRDVQDMEELRRRSRDSLLSDLSLLDGIPDAEHPALAPAPSDPAEAGRQVVRAAATMRKDDIIFPFDDEVSAEVVNLLNDANEGPIVLPSATAKDRQREIVRSACDRLVDDEIRRGLAMRHLDRAWVRRAAGDAEGAERDACIGSVLLRAPRSEEAARFVEAYAMTRVKKRGERQPEPDDEPPRSPGGIILP